MTNPTAAQRIQDVRDLKGQIQELQNDPDEQEIIFRETSPRRRKATVYSMVDGEPVEIPRSLLERALEKPQPNGEYMFTARQEQAPEYKRGEVKCFLHPESPERLSGVLEAAGIAGHRCDSAHLASRYAMEEVAKSKHKKQWQALRAFLDQQDKEEERAERRLQLDATLALAGRAVGQPASFACEDCGKEFDANSKLAGHRNLAHKGT